MTTRQDIYGWLQRGQRQKATHLIVVCDTFEHDDYPVFVSPGESAREKYSEYNGKSMQRVMEVYSIDDDWERQLEQTNCMNFDIPTKKKAPAKKAAKKKAAKKKVALRTYMKAPKNEPAKLSGIFMDQVEKTMKAKGVSRADLARRLECSRAQVTQMFKTKNLTLMTMVKTADALGLEVQFKVTKPKPAAGSQAALRAGRAAKAAALEIARRGR